MKKRQLIYIPKINPNTFLLFYFEGNSGRSYSLRDYTFPTNPPKITYAKEYPYLADEIIVMATWHFDADTISTDNVDYWRDKIQTLNQRYLKILQNSNQQVSMTTINQEITVNPERKPAYQTSSLGKNTDSTLLILSRSGQQIRSVDDWFCFAPPKKGSDHWKDGRSAKELARAWFRTGSPKCPVDLDALLKSHPSTADCVIETAFPEMTTRLDHFHGGGRNHDLILLGHNKDHKILISIEAKADETFGRLIHDELTPKNPHSRTPDRIRLLATSIFGRPIDTALEDLRYQLLYGLAGTLIEAKNQQATLAVFVIHEFISSHTNSTKVNLNDMDFRKFIQSLPGCSGTIVTLDKFAEGIKIPGGQYVPTNIPVLIGKIKSKID